MVRNTARLKSSKFAIELIVKLAIACFFILMIYSAVFEYSTVLDYFKSAYIYLFIASVVLYIIFRIKSQNQQFSYIEDVIYEILIYRKMTPVNALAKRLDITEDQAYEIINVMLEKQRIFGQIINGIFQTSSPVTPKCFICNEHITDSLRLIVCPFCRKPFHKDHLLDYLEKQGETCPNCKRALTLADLYIE